MVCKTSHSWVPWRLQGENVPWQCCPIARTGPLLWQWRGRGARRKMMSSLPWCCSPHSWRFIPWSLVSPVKCQVFHFYILFLLGFMSGLAAGQGSRFMSFGCSQSRDLQIAASGKLFPWVWYSYTIDFLNIHKDRIVLNMMDIYYSQRIHPFTAKF